MKYYCIKQHDITDCGAACIATVSKQYGLSTSITKIREVAGTDKLGTNAYGMVKAAEQLGFTAKAVKGNRDVFFSDSCWCCSSNPNWWSQLSTCRCLAERCHRWAGKSLILFILWRANKNEK